MTRRTEVEIRLEPARQAREEAGGVAPLDGPATACWWHQPQWASASPLGAAAAHQELLEPIKEPIGWRWSRMDGF